MGKSYSVFRATMTEEQQANYWRHADCAMPKFLTPIASKPAPEPQYAHKAALAELADALRDC